ncbi:ABC transporter permease [Streptomyces sp. NPDC101150]|uniref:ABC transporter permease n=1 Tax=Streptomyces sp. NPDC101150 TaxID=3366114 RepID=UPI00382C5419
MTSPSQTAVTETDTPGPGSEGATSKKGRKNGALTGRSPGQLMWARFKRDRTGITSACVVLFFFAIGLLAPVISKIYGKDPYTQYGVDTPGLLVNQYPAGPNGGISSDFWFGIEPSLGRDVFMQLLYGIRNTLGLAVAITLISVLTAIVLGVTAGYFGGRTDYFIGRVIDLLMAFPNQLFYVAFVPVVSAIFVAPADQMPDWLRVTIIILVMWFLGWMSLARLLRGQVLSLREREYIEAAKISGASPWRIIRRELIPNVMTPILVQTTYMLPNFVTSIAGLSFLGVGLVEPTPDWGRMFANAADYYHNDITYLFFPGLAMVLFIVAFNLLGDSVRDAFDPKRAR